MIYINGIGNISPQLTNQDIDFLSDVRSYQTNMLQCIEPDYTNFLPPNALRRMSRVIKMGWAGAKSCLDDAGLEKPDSIVVGTGKGCFKSTQVFLSTVDQNEERFVPPSPFIQSAHSSIASQIAIQTGCQNYNMTYAHRVFSFESALLDAMMLLQEGKHNNVLLGGIDEIEEVQFKTFDRIGHYKNPDVSSTDLLKVQSKGTIAGEGSNFFLIENKVTERTYAGIKGLHTFSNPENTTEVITQIEGFLYSHQLEFEDLDVVVLGMNGDVEFDEVYNKLRTSVFAEARQAYYKHLCGDYHTSSAFALWVSSLFLHHQKIPATLDLNKKRKDKINNILIYNHYRNVNHSLILLQNPNQ